MSKVCHEDAMNQNIMMKSGDKDSRYQIIGREGGG